MEFGMRETPENNNAGAPAEVPADRPFAVNGPAPTELPVTPDSALDHIPRPYDPVAECERAEASVIARYAEKPQKTGGIKFAGEGMDATTLAARGREWRTHIERLHKGSFRGETRLNDWERQSLAIADAGIDAVAATVNVTIDPPAVAPVRVFKKYEDYETAIKRLHGEDSDQQRSGGRFDVRAGILLPRGEDTPGRQRYALTHERIHQRGLSVITFEPLPPGDTRILYNESSGLDRYGEPQRIHNVNEGVTDMMAVRILRNAGQEVHHGHLGAALLLDGVVHETAYELGMPEQYVEFALYRSALSDDDEAVAMIEDALGPERATLFWNLGEVPLEQTELAAHMLHLPETAAYAKSLAADPNAGAFLYDWQPYN